MILLHSTLTQSIKAKLANYIRANLGVNVSPDALFDIQCKRLHEYKRQFMNILAVIYRYIELKKMSVAEIEKIVPRVGEYISLRLVLH